MTTISSVLAKPRIGYDGELWLAPHCFPMSTVIAAFRVPDGFVIASDGRVTDGSDSRLVLSDDAQKIFPVETPGVSLAYGLAGTIKIGESSDNVLFDFGIEVAKATNRFAQNKPQNWWTYVAAVAESLNESLGQVRRTSPLPYKPSENSKSWIFIGGVYGKHIKSAHIMFCHGPEETEVDPHTHPPGFNGPFGSKAVFELLDAEDARFSQYVKPKRDHIFTLPVAIERARNDVQAHCDPEALKVDEEGCRIIGGRVQIATATRADGFRWVPGFEPINPRPLL